MKRRKWIFVDIKDGKETAWVEMDMYGKQNNSQDDKKNWSQWNGKGNKGLQEESRGKLFMMLTKCSSTPPFKIEAKCLRLR